jgi:hypothetical protein
MVMMMMPFICSYSSRGGVFITKLFARAGGGWRGGGQHNVFHGVPPEQVPDCGVTFLNFSLSRRGKKITMVFRGPPADGHFQSKSSTVVTTLSQQRTGVTKRCISRSESERVFRLLLDVIFLGRVALNCVCVCVYSQSVNLLRTFGNSHFQAASRVICV